MFSDIFKELEESERELDRSMKEMNETKSRVMSSIADRHKELHEAMESLNRTMNGTNDYNFNKSSESSYEKYSETDKMIDETSRELDELLASL